MLVVDPKFTIVNREVLPDRPTRVTPFKCELVRFALRRWIAHLNRINSGRAATRSRNKVYVGEPTEGSLSRPLNKRDHERVIHVVGLLSDQGPFHWRGATKEPTVPKASRNTDIALLGVILGLPRMPHAMLLS